MKDLKENVLRVGSIFPVFAFKKLGLKLMQVCIGFLKSINFYWGAENLCSLVVEVMMKIEQDFRFHCTHKDKICKNKTN